MVQCGADCIAGDPIGGFNVTPAGLSACVGLVLDRDLPTLLLGGGGYCLANTARTWAAITAGVLCARLPEDVPAEDKFFPMYGPGYEMAVSAGCVRNMNLPYKVEETLKAALGNVEKIPSVR